MKPLEISPAARSDLIGIGRYIAEDNPERAVSFVAELEAKVMKVARCPLSFPPRDDISPGLRSASHGRYLVLFRDLADRVRIVRILHGARDLSGMFNA